MHAADVPIALILLIVSPALTAACSSTDPLSNNGPTLFGEVGGLVAVEAEHFASSDNRGLSRDWYRTSANHTPRRNPDPDPNHAESASGNAYLEVLPDTRVTHDDPINDALYNRGGEGPTLTYRIQFETAGLYYAHARAYSTGTEDNGMHIGINSDWPESGRRVQWCGGKDRWTWSSALRDSGGQVCGVDDSAQIIVPEAGEHEILISMREDGFELDKLILTQAEGYKPDGAGPDENPLN